MTFKARNDFGLFFVCVLYVYVCVVCSHVCVHMYVEGNNKLVPFCPPSTRLRRVQLQPRWMFMLVLGIQVQISHHGYYVAASLPMEPPPQRYD